MHTIFCKNIKKKQDCKYILLVFNVFNLFIHLFETFLPPNAQNHSFIHTKRKRELLQYHSQW